MNLTRTPVRARVGFRNRNSRSRSLALVAALVTVVLSACVPVIPGLRNIDGQTWAARFDVEVSPAGIGTFRLPVDLALSFTQRLQDLNATATLEYDVGLFRLETGRLVDLQGRIGFDDSVSLQGSQNVLRFEGGFVGDTLVGTVSIAGLVPVGNVAFTRVR